jgi:hypothetical protein
MYFHHPGESWQPEGYPDHQPHEYVRNGTAKVGSFLSKIKLVRKTAQPHTVTV